MTLLITFTQEFCCCSVTTYATYADVKCFSVPVKDLLVIKGIEYIVAKYVAATWNSEPH